MTRSVRRSKKGAVRRDTVAQALDYASCVATMPFEQLSQRGNAYLAGKGSAETLESILASRLGTTAVHDEPRNIVIFVVEPAATPVWIAWSST